MWCVLDAIVTVKEIDASHVLMVISVSMENAHSMYLFSACVDFAPYLGTYYEGALLYYQFP